MKKCEARSPGWDGLTSATLPPRVRRATKTLLTAIVAALCLGGVAPRGASAQADAEGQAPSFPTAAEVVTVDVVVLDESGDPIEGLTADDFTIIDEGRRRTVSRFEAVVVPESPPTSPPVSALLSSNAEEGTRPERTFVVVFDDVHMDPIAARAAKRAVRQFVETMLRPGDLVTLVPGSGGPWWHARIPEGQRDLVAALERLEGPFHGTSRPAGSPTGRPCASTSTATSRSEPRSRGATTSTGSSSTHRAPRPARERR